MKYLYILSFCVICFSTAQSQSLIVGNNTLEDFYRRKQLTGELDSSVSFTVRPLPGILQNSSTARFTDSLMNIGRPSGESPQQKFSFRFLPLSWDQQYHSEPSYALNDGALIPAKGYQTRIATGFYATAGPVSLQMRPEFVYAQNNEFEVVVSHFSHADLPYRFGDEPYSKVNFGQSSLRITFAPVSFGISNENLWWGPGVTNSLIMSNTAPGFKHLTLNTSRPVKTPIGSFEGQVIAGRLESSGYNDVSDEWRYLSGMVITYQPRWIPGLFLGITRVFQSYSSNINRISDYFPLFTPFQKKKDKNQDSFGTDTRDQLTSIFSRLVLPQSKSEIYFEYGLNDHSYNIRDFVMTPEHSRSYVLGMRKLFPYQNAEDRYIQFGAEITRLEQSIDRTIRQAGEWYTHSPIVQGYTHSGEVLGAGIGPGGNSQVLDISLVENIKSMGVRLMRYEHNGDLATYFSYSPWIDFSMAAYSDWTYKKFIISPKIIGIQSINYQWRDGLNGRDKRNQFSINANLGIMYTF